MKTIQLTWEKVAAVRRGEAMPKWKPKQRMKTTLIVPRCSKCFHVPQMTLGKWYFEPSCPCSCGGRYNETAIQNCQVFVKQLQAQAALANKKNQQGFAIRKTENGFWAIVKSEHKSTT